MLRTLSESLFVQADVTYPQTAAFRYLLNIVCFNYETLQFQAGARILMNNLSTQAYEKAFGKAMEVTTNVHPGFENGKIVQGWILDFSTSQLDGLKKLLGDDADEKVRGCDVHFMRNGKKVAGCVSPLDDSAQKVFKKIAYGIPKLALPEDVALAFSILIGKASFSDEDARQLLEGKIQLSPAELTVSTDGWSKATEWAKFWQRPKILKLYSVAHKDMTDATWAVCPRTTNACESQNKISHAKSSSTFAALQTLYRTDRRSAYYNAAAKRGITTGVSDRKRRITNQKKLRRINRRRR